MMISLYDGKGQPVYEHDNITLSIFMHTPRCTFWTEDSQTWGSAGCKVWDYIGHLIMEHSMLNKIFFSLLIMICPVSSRNI